MAEKTNEEIIRVRIPKDKEGQLFGVVDKLLGSAKMYVRCSDGRTRLCRIPGALKRGMWVKLNDVVIVRPWEVQGDERGDIIYRYISGQVNWLRKKGYLKELEEEF